MSVVLIDMTIKFTCCNIKLPILILLPIFKCEGEYQTNLQLIAYQKYRWHNHKSFNLPLLQNNGKQ